MTIIKYINAYESLGFEGMNKDVYDLFQQALSQQQAESNNRISTAHVRLFDLFLQATGKRLSTLDLSHPSFSLICDEFVGALQTPSFIDINEGLIITYLSKFRDVLRKIKCTVPSLAAPESLLEKGKDYSQYRALCINKFAIAVIDEQKASELTSWSFKNRAGNLVHLHLFPMAKRLGFEFTNKFAAAVGDFITARRTCGIPEIKSLSNYIESYPEDLTPEHFLDSTFVTTFMRKFLNHYFISQYNKGCHPDYILSNWRARFSVVMEEYVFPANIMSEQFGAFPKPHVKTSKVKSKIKTTNNGIEVHHTLLTDVPLEVSDKQALELLFHQIQNDVSIIETWAEKKSAEIWSRHCTTKNLANNGVVRGVDSLVNYGKALNSFVNSDNWLTDVSATFKHYGYFPQTHTKHSLKLLYGRQSEAAHHLVFPNRETLLPFLTLLVMDYPIITPSLLDNLELYNKENKRTGWVKMDSGNYILNGGKERTKGHQPIIMSGRGIALIKKIIEITTPQRAFLKSIGNDNYRLLLLRSSGGFGFPKKVETSHFTHVETNKRISEELQQETEIESEHADKLARRFSLRTLRASAGVLVYLETKSVSKMAEALGHARYDPDLLNRYLPEAIQAFFRDRWIRIFQTGIVLEALKDSAYLIEASGFKTMAQVYEFLENHALKSIPDHSEHLEENKYLEVNQSQQNEVIFGVSTSVLTLLLSIKQAVDEAKLPVSGVSKYWAQIADRLTNHIETSMSHRADLQTYLSEAMEKANPNLVGGLVNE